MSKELEEQVVTLLELTNTMNVLDAIEYVKALQRIVVLKEAERKEWADMCIKKQAWIEQLESKL